MCRLGLDSWQVKGSYTRRDSLHKPIPCMANCEVISVAYPIYTPYKRIIHLEEHFSYLSFQLRTNQLHELLIAKNHVGKMAVKLHSRNSKRIYSNLVYRKFNLYVHWLQKFIINLLSASGRVFFSLLGHQAPPDAPEWRVSSPCPAPVPPSEGAESCVGNAPSASLSPCADWTCPGEMTVSCCAYGTPPSSAMQ